MKTMVLAAFGVLALGVGAASAQGYAGATAPMYGQKWAEIQLAKRADAFGARVRAGGHGPYGGS